MKNADVIRAWKDEEYRLSLSEAQRSMIPPNPVGLIELTDAELGGAAGGGFPSANCSWNCSWCFCSWDGTCPLPF
jgi:mersacidin/lichenicidin family type 2 lantibiotic